MLFACSGFGSVGHVGITVFGIGLGTVGGGNGLPMIVLDVLDEVVVMRDPNASSSERPLLDKIKVNNNNLSQYVKSFCIHSQPVDGSSVPEAETRTVVFWLGFIGCHAHDDRHCFIVFLPPKMYSAFSDLQ